jgi:hypothetical protein
MAKDQKINGYPTGLGVHSYLEMSSSTKLLDKKC